MYNIKKTICLLLLCASITSYAQEDASAIKWVTALSWKQVQQKAKNENKYIFIDCYATWCKPCKEMDIKVYTVDSVGEFLNKGFISVKVQMDVTKNDNAFVKSWYKTAKNIGSQYWISAYPSYVFFAPSGEVVSKETGYKNPADFLQVVRDAKDPSKQYFVLLKNYKKGKLDDASKRLLVRMAKQLNDSANYQELRKSYFAYLHALPKDKLYTKENIEFIASFISRRSHPVFDMFYPDGSIVDKVMEKKGYAQKVVDEVIMKEKMAAVLNAAMDAKKEPDWTSLYNSIAKDFKDDYADRNVMEAKISWYMDQGDYIKLTPLFNEKMEKYGTDTTNLGVDYFLNNMAFWIWEKFGTSKELNSETKTELKRVCVWMEGVVRRAGKATNFYHNYWPNYIDTYANLLYKAGETAEAIKWQEFAVSKTKEPGDAVYDKAAVQENLNKMKSGEPTWPIKEK